LNKTLKYVIYISIFFCVGFGINFLLDYRQSYLLLKNTKITFALYHKSFISVGSGKRSVFQFNLKGKKVFFIIMAKYDFLQKGDTVQIMYSVEDPEIVEVIDYCYMKKYKGKCAEY